MLVAEGGDAAAREHTLGEPQRDAPVGLLGHDLEGRREVPIRLTPTAGWAGSAPELIRHGARAAPCRGTEFSRRRPGGLQTTLCLCLGLKRCETALGVAVTPSWRESKRPGRLWSARHRTPWWRVFERFGFLQAPRHHGVARLIPRIRIVPTALSFLPVSLGVSWRGVIHQVARSRSDLVAPDRLAASAGPTVGLGTPIEHMFASVVKGGF